MSDATNTVRTDRHVISGAGVPPALGPYSPAIRVGDLIFLSAQSGVDPRTGILPDGGFDQECRQAFRNVEDVLAAAGGHLSDVAKMTILYRHPESLPVINATYSSFFPSEPPARTMAVVQLAANRSISIDAIAVVRG
jgi:2-iminobutanoate/2-iminopropanoate deaminase